VQKYAFGNAVWRARVRLIVPLELTMKISGIRFLSASANKPRH